MLAITLLALALAGCGSSAQAPSLAFKLATLDKRSPSGNDDAMLRPYNAALDGLVSRCKETRERLGDEAVVAQQELSKRSVSETLLSILQHTLASIPGGAPRMRCADVFASYVVLRSG